MNTRIHTHAYNNMQGIQTVPMGTFQTTLCTNMTIPHVEPHLALCKQATHYTPTKTHRHHHTQTTPRIAHASHPARTG